MNAKLSLAATVVVLTVALNFASAQDYAPRSTPATYAQSYATPYGRPHLGSVYGTGTASSAYVRGLADYVRAAGEYNYNTSVANSVNQQAYSQSLDNQVKRVETYIQKRDLNRRYLSRRTRTLSPAAAQAISQARLPERLDAAQLNPTLGQIHWPSSLATDDLAAERLALESLFAKRAFENGGLGTENFAQIRQRTEAMRSVLRSKIRKMDPAEYLAAKKFIDGLAYEGRFAAVQTEQVAQR